MRNRVLLIEDDLGLALPLKDFFEDNGLDVLFTANGEEGLLLYNEYRPDLVVLDIILPGKSGFEVITAIRNTDLETPVVLITGTEIDPDSQIKGYRLGAINYMQKPILPQALLSLIQHILAIPTDFKQFRLGDHQIRIHAQAVEIDGNLLTARDKDTRLMEFLLNRKGQVVPRATLLKQIWLDDHPDKNNLLDGAVSRIRRLLNKHPDIQIKTVYGGGYLLEG